MKKQHIEERGAVTVFGSGVIALTTAIELKNSGYNVTIVSGGISKELTQTPPVAIWQYPAGSDAATQKWSMSSYDRFSKMNPEETGVYFQRKSSHFEETSNLLSKPQESAIPVINAPAYMNYLQNEARRLGCTIIKDGIEENIIKNEAELLERYQSDLLVNCSELGAIDVASNVYPSNTSYIALEDPQGKVMTPYIGEKHMVIPIPNTSQVAIVGQTGINRWDTNRNFDDAQIRALYAEAVRFNPQLRELTMGENPIQTTLYSNTQNGICITKTPGSRILHNYGHGEQGFGLSWGCAQEIVTMANRAIAQEQNLTQEPYAPYLIKDFDPSKPTVFLIQDDISHRADFAKLNKDVNLVFIGSEASLNILSPSQYHNFNLVKVVDDFTTKGVSEEIRTISKRFGIDLSQVRIVTSDDLCVGLSAELREILNVSGDRPPVLSQFSSKTRTKEALAGSDVLLPRNMVFDRKKYAQDKNGYLGEIVATVGEEIFVKMIEGAGSENTAKIIGKEELEKWCETNISNEIGFEIDEFVQGQLYNVSFVFQNGKPVYFSALEHAVPNDEFLHGQTLGNWMIRENDPRFEQFKKYAQFVLDSLKEGYPQNGVINIDFFVDQNQRPILMEIGARAPGGLISAMYETCDNAHLEELHLKLLIDNNCHLGDISYRNNSAAYVLFPCIDDKVREIITQDLKSKHTIMWRIYPEKQMVETTSMRQSALGIMLHNEDSEALKRDYEKLLSNPVYKGYKNRTDEERLEASKLLQSAFRKGLFRGNSTSESRPRSSSSSSHASQLMDINHLHAQG